MKCTQDLGEGYYITYRLVSNRMGGLHPADIFLKKYDDEEFSVMISNKFGDFIEPPEFVDGDWKDELKTCHTYGAMFTLEFSGFKNGKCLIRWLVQPDGRYFADDDGFGAEPFNEVALYSLMDTNGKFLVPFTPDREALEQIYLSSVDA